MKEDAKGALRRHTHTHTLCLIQPYSLMLALGHSQMCLLCSTHKADLNSYPPLTREEWRGRGDGEGGTSDLKGLDQGESVFTWCAVYFSTKCGERMSGGRYGAKEGKRKRGRGGRGGKESSEGGERFDKTWGTNWLSSCSQIFTVKHSSCNNGQ